MDDTLLGALRCYAQNIIDCADLLQAESDGCVNPDQQTCVEGIRRSVVRLVDLLMIFGVTPTPDREEVLLLLKYDAPAPISVISGYSAILLSELDSTLTEGQTNVVNQIKAYIENFEQMVVQIWSQLK